jgi:hypothetical protein
LKNGVLSKNSIFQRRSSKFTENCFVNVIERPPEIGYVLKYGNSEQRFVGVREVLTMDMGFLPYS